MMNMLGPDVGWRKREDVNMLALNSRNGPITLMLALKKP
jgi:hypothetical protein